MAVIGSENEREKGEIGIGIEKGETGIEGGEAVQGVEARVRIVRDVAAAA